MSGESKKPVITRAGKKSESVSAPKKKPSWRERRKQAKKVAAEKKRAEDAITRKAILHRQKEQANTSSGSERTQGSASQTARTKPKISKATVQKTAETVKKQKKVKKKKTKKTHKSSKKARLKTKKIPLKSALAIIIGITVIATAVYGVTRGKETGFVSSDSTSAGLLGESDVSTDSKPSFVRINPTTSAGDLRSHYDPDRGVFSFQEEIFGKLITVNQQPIPPEFELTADILLLDNDWTSVGKFDTHKGTVYIAKTDNSTLNAVAFKFNGLLIFIKSDYEITPSQWAEYINSL